MGLNEALARYRNADKDLEESVVRRQACGTILEIERENILPIIYEILEEVRVEEEEEWGDFNIFDLDDIVPPLTQAETEPTQPTTPSIPVLAGHPEPQEEEEIEENEEERHHQYAQDRRNPNTVKKTESVSVNNSPSMLISGRERRKTGEVGRFHFGTVRENLL